MLYHESRWKLCIKNSIVVYDSITLCILLLNLSFLFPLQINFCVSGYMWWIGDQINIVSMVQLFIPTCSYKYLYFCWICICEKLCMWYVSHCTDLYMVYVIQFFMCKSIWIESKNNGTTTWLFQVKSVRMLWLEHDCHCCAVAWSLVLIMTIEINILYWYKSSLLAFFFDTYCITLFSLVVSWQ